MQEHVSTPKKQITVNTNICNYTWQHLTKLLATSAGTMSSILNLKVTVFCLLVSSWHSTAPSLALSTVSLGPLGLLRRLAGAIIPRLLPCRLSDCPSSVPLKIKISYNRYPMFYQPSKHLWIKKPTIRNIIWYL